MLRVPKDGPIAQSHFRDLPSFLRRGDLLVLNDARVIKARLRGRKVETGGEVEILLERPCGPPYDVGSWYTLGSASKGFRPGQRLELGGSKAMIEQVLEDGRLVVAFEADPLTLAGASGEL